MTITTPDAVTPRSAAGDTAAAPAKPAFGHKPALDGLRAVAVLSVFAYHLDYGWAKGGFLGVDMFFVLSGYLITSLLLVEWAGNGTIRFGAFWARRARRLLPAVFLLLIVVAIWGRIVLPSSEWGALRADGLWTMFYGANWHYIWAGQSYFSPSPSPLRHTWSLAIEEQFYLVWPLVVFASLKLARGRRWLLATVAVLGVGGSLYALASHYTAGADPSRPYYGTDARAGQMLVGALLGMLLLRVNPVRRLSRVLLQVASVGAAAAILYAFATAESTGSRLYHGGFLLFALATAVLIAAVVQPSRNPLRALFAWRPMRWIGAVSYGVYLWHWPIIVFLNESRTGLSGWRLDALRVGLTFAVAACSYYLVELPIRQRRFLKVWTPRLALAGAAALTVGVMVVAAIGATAPDPLRAEAGTTLRGREAPTDLPAADPSIPTRNVLLLGDSVAYTLGDALTAAAANDGVRAHTIGRLGCGMTTGIALNADGTRVSWSPDCAAGTVEYQTSALDQYRPDTLLWQSTWESSDYEVDGQRVRAGTRAWEQWLLGEMERVRQLAASRGARLALVTNPPTAPNPTREVTADDLRRIRQLNDVMKEFAQLHPDVALVDLAAIVCPEGATVTKPCAPTRDGIVLRPKDGGHYEADGAAWVAPRLLDALYAALGRDGGASITTSTTGGG